METPKYASTGFESNHAAASRDGTRENDRIFTDPRTSVDDRVPGDRAVVAEPQALGLPLNRLKPFQIEVGTSDNCATMRLDPITVAIAPDARAV